MVTPTPVPGSAPSNAGPGGPAPAIKKEPAEKTEKVAKEKKPRVKKEGAVPRPRAPKYDENHLITVLKENAKARNANERFKRYHTGMTVKSYLDKMRDEFSRTDGQTMADMRWDEDHKFIHVGPTTVAVPPPAPKEAPAHASA